MEVLISAETAEDGLLKNSENAGDSSQGSIVEEGCLYEINHKQLPPKSPNHLKSIRIVMVTEKTDFNVSVKFPSISSLRKYFGKQPGANMGRKKQGQMTGQAYPELDEQFVMGRNLAGKVLQRQISSEEWTNQIHLDRFWLVSGEDKPKVIGSRSIVLKEELAEKEILVEQKCLSLIESGGLGSWGVRRKVRYIGKHVEQSSSFNPDDSNQTSNRQCKRFLENSGDGGQRKAVKREKLIKIKPHKDMQGRWSAERYKAAQLKLFEIMRAKGAVYGKPILRPVLRDEARKHIGDTGLLDHLLKHMTNTVVSDGERFRRHHNAQGAMEYWLEPAGLMELRKAAGVKNSYWEPPPGWRPGDDLSPFAVSCEEVKLLRDDVAKIKRDLENLGGANVATVSVKQEAETLTTRLHGGEWEKDPMSYFQGICTTLLKRKSELEEQMDEVSNSLRQMQKEIQQYMEKVEVNNGAKKVEEEEVNNGAKKVEKERAIRSGFRICKPEGTFLWPHAGYKALNSMSVEEILVSTPPSASSATSAAPFKPVVKNTTTLPAVSCVLTESGVEEHRKLTRSDSTPNNGITWQSCYPFQYENLQPLQLQAQSAERMVWASEWSQSPGTAGGSTMTELTQQTSSPSSWMALASPSSSAFVTRG